MKLMKPGKMKARKGYYCMKCKKWHYDYGKTYRKHYYMRKIGKEFKI